MATKKTSAKDVMKPHSEAKVNFYQKYLEIKLLILSSTSFVREVHVYDLFCGRGVYADGKTGSAIRAYETIRKVRQDRPSDKRIVLHLNDKNKKHIEAVKEYITSHYPDEHPCEVKYTNEDASKMLKFLAARSWLGMKPKGVLNVFFIDPYGYKEIKRSFLEQLMSSGDSEILLFLPISFMHRFTRHAFSKDVTPGAIPLRNLIADFFPKGHPIMTEEMEVQTYIDHLTKAFSCGKKFYTTSYPIERNSHNQFALFFFSTNLFGYEKVLEMKWKMMDAFGFGFHQVVGQLGMFDDFFKQERIAEMKEQFRVNLTNYMRRARTNGNLYKFAVTNDFLPKHVKDILREWQKAGKLEIVDMTTGEVIEKRNVFKVEYKALHNPNLRFVMKK